MSTPHPIPFPADLSGFVRPGALDALGPTEIGCLYRLTRLAWVSLPVGGVPASPSSLAVVAGVTPEQWGAVERLLWPAADARLEGDLVVFPRVVQAHLTLSQQADRRRQRTAAATAARLNVTSTLRPRDVDVTRPSRSAAPPLRSDPERSKSEALSLQRPSRHIDPLPSAPQGAQTGVLALLGDRARAIQETKLADWRRARCRGLLESAFAAWSKAGRTTAPYAKAMEIARTLEAPSPAVVETVIELAGDPRNRNPVGYLLVGLGLAEGRDGRRRVFDASLQAERGWATQEDEYRSLLRMSSSMEAARSASEIKASTR